MRLEVRRRGLCIIPENEQDRAYVVDTMGIRGEGQSVPLRWVSVSGLPSYLAYLTTEEDILSNPE